MAIAPRLVPVLVTLSNGTRKRHYVHGYTRFPSERFVQRMERLGHSAVIEGRWAKRHVDTSNGYAQTYFVPVLQTL